MAILFTSADFFFTSASMCGCFLLCVVMHPWACSNCLSLRAAKAWYKWKSRKWFYNQALCIVLRMSLSTCLHCLPFFEQCDTVDSHVWIQEWNHLKRKQGAGAWNLAAVGTNWLRYSGCPWLPGCHWGLPPPIPGRKGCLCGTRGLWVPCCVVEAFCFVQPTWIGDAHGSPAGSAWLSSCHTQGQVKQWSTEDLPKPERLVASSREMLPVENAAAKLGHFPEFRIHVTTSNPSKCSVLCIGWLPRQTWN